MTDLPSWDETDRPRVQNAVHAVGLRATYEQLGSFCGQLCRGIEMHHRIEDAHEMLVHLRGLLESHSAYEEEQIGLPLGVHRILI